MVQALVPYSYLNIILSVRLGLFVFCSRQLSASHEDLETLMGHHYDFEFWKDPT